MLKYLMLAAVFFVNSDKHPIHVSVCDIEHDAERKALEITQNIFIDDLEKAIRAELNEPMLDIMKPTKERTTDQLVEAYLTNHLKLDVNGKQEAYNYLGHQVEGPAIYCFIEILKVKKLKSLLVYNNILLDTYDDQANLIHIKVDGKTRSMKLTPSHREETMTFEN